MDFAHLRYSPEMPLWVWPIQALPRDPTWPRGGLYLDGDGNGTFDKDKDYGFWAVYDSPGVGQLRKPFYFPVIMALLMVMTVCWLVYAALEYRIRHALKDHGATFPHQKGTPVQNPTARWVFHDFVGIHVLFIPGPWPPRRSRACCTACS